MKVLVVDDSVVFRTAIKTSLAGHPNIKEVKTASNGKIAIEMLKAETFDAVTIDLEMPILDGVETIKGIREFNQRIPIIIFSAQNINAANKTLRALEMGANDFVQKIEGSGDVSENLKMIQAELVPRFSALLAKNIAVPKSITATNSSSVKLENQIRPDLICIGTSTGGPDTLKNIFKQLKSGIKTPILIVQHMPPIFTTQLAIALNQTCDMTVTEAKDGEEIIPGHVYLAPGDYHMELRAQAGKNFIKLHQGEKVCYVRPAVDVMLKSVAQNFNGKVATFILTGMGNDGAQGCLQMKEIRKGPIYIQEESSCVVYGMPKAVADLSLYDYALNIHDLAIAINNIT
jgi:two-component system, chemotaxis family, protein-glutamate methylesterase/glutaminase